MPTVNRIGTVGDSGNPLAAGGPGGDLPERPTPRQDTALNDYLRPGRIGAFAPYLLRTVAITGGVPALLTTAAPGRVGLLLCHDGLSATVGQCGPLRDNTVHPVLWVPGKTLVGGTLDALLSLVMAEWWFTISADVTVSLVEFIRPI